MPLSTLVDESNPTQRYVYINSAMPLTALSDLFKKALQEDKHNSLHCQLGKERVVILLNHFQEELTIQNIVFYFLSNGQESAKAIK